MKKILLFLTLMMAFPQVTIAREFDPNIEAKCQELYEDSGLCEAWHTPEEETTKTVTIENTENTINEGINKVEDIINTDFKGKLEDIINDTENEIEETIDYAQDKAIDYIKNKALEQTNTILNDLLGGVFGDIIGEIKGAINQVKDYINDFLSFEIPDFKGVVDVVFNELPQTSSNETANDIEGTTESYSVKKDTIQKVTRALIEESISNSTTGETGQRKLKEITANVANSLEASKNLSEDSQNSDVTQQILQNMSQQATETNGLLGTLALQNSQNQIDNANQIMLEIQQAEILAGQATKARRETSAFVNQTGMLRGVLSRPILYEKEGNEQ